METSRKTSLLLQHRAAHIVDFRLAEIERAFLSKDFETFGRITMQDSNQFHATCLDTYPPIFYMNDTSKQIIKLVHAFNEYHGSILAAYTFDAGPNAVIYTLEQHVDSILAMVATFFPPPGNTESYCNRPDRYESALQNAGALLPADLQLRLHSTGRVVKAGDVKYVFVTKSGAGPICQPASERLLDPVSGLQVEPGPSHKRMRISEEN